MFLHDVGLVTCTLYALERTYRTFIQSLLAMRHLMSSQSIMVIRLIFARRTLEFFIIKMYSPMIFEFQIRCKSFLANITFETIINRFMIFVDVNFEISHVKK